MKWLIKSEPNEWSIDDHKKVGETIWDGVRNFQARNYMREMKKGDLCLFYHSRVQKSIVGIVEVIKESFPDPKDSKFVAVDMKYIKHLKCPVSLEKIKNSQLLEDLPLIRQSRLSVMPITEEQWKILMDFSEQGNSGK